jgi:hypothetical protein
MKECGRDGKCTFTPKGYLSATTFCGLTSCLTAGYMKSMSGLDDTWVLKGCGNFKSLHEIVKKAFDSKRKQMPSSSGNWL